MVPSQFLCAILIKVSIRRFVNPASSLRSLALILSSNTPPSLSTQVSPRRPPPDAKMSGHPLRMHKSTLLREASTVDGTLVVSIYTSYSVLLRIGLTPRNTVYDNCPQRLIPTTKA
jgi:hypothetical protein